MNLTYLDKLILSLLKGTYGIKNKRLQALVRVVCVESEKRGRERIVSDWSQTGTRWSSATVGIALTNLLSAKLIKTHTTPSSLTYIIEEGIPTLSLRGLDRLLIWDLQKRRFHTCQWKYFTNNLERQLSRPYILPQDPTAEF